MFVYLTDSKSIKSMENFWNKNMKSQNKKEDMKEWIGSEYYLQTSLYYILKQHFLECNIVCIDKIKDEDLINLLEKAKVIISPGWLSAPRNIYLPFKNKLYSYIYNRRKSKWLQAKNWIWPWYTENHSFIPLTAIPLPDLNNYKPSFSSLNYRGLLYGKCISHVTDNGYFKQNLDFLNNISITLFSTLRNLSKSDTPRYVKDKENYYINTQKILNLNNICNLGILNPIDFRLLLRKVKYVIFFHSAWAPSTLIECINENCIILATRDSLPKDLVKYKNVYIIDNKSIAEINKLILDIENDIIKFIPNDNSFKYSTNRKIMAINELLNQDK